MAERRAVLVVLSGLPGVGKSTVARALADETGALWLRADAIEQEMRESHMVCDDLADGGYAAMRAVARGALGQGYDVISDSVNPVALTRAPWEALWPRRVTVALSCADAAAHRARLETRVVDIPGHAPKGWDDMRRRVFAPYDTANLRLDTGVHSVAQSVARISQRMEERRWQT